MLLNGKIHHIDLKERNLYNVNNHSNFNVHGFAVNGDSQFYIYEKLIYYTVVSGFIVNDGLITHTRDAMTQGRFYCRK